MKHKIPIRYYDLPTILVRINPITKLVWLILLSVEILSINDYRIETGMLVVILMLFQITKVRIIDLQGSKFVLVTVVIIGLMHLFFTRVGVPILSYGKLLITDIGYQNAILIAARFLSFVFIGYLFVITTEPNEFVYSLMKIGLPYRIGFSMITALRLIPIFTNEAAQIFHAQITRGVTYQAIRPKALFNNIYQFLKTLLVSMIKKVDGLVLSMEGRSFGASQTRTFSHSVGYSKLDIGLLIAAGLTILIQIYLGAILS